MREIAQIPLTSFDLAINLPGEEGRGRRGERRGRKGSALTSSPPPFPRRTWFLRASVIRPTVEPLGGILGTASRLLAITRRARSAPPPSTYTLGNCRLRAAVSGHARARGTPIIAKRSPARSYRCRTRRERVLHLEVSSWRGAM